jgi:chorismate mutase
MIETHPSPERALTDCEQQLTPAQLAEMLCGLVVRSTDSVVADEELRLMREQIDQIDGEVLRLLAARSKVAERIARVKREGNLAVFQPKRWDAVLHDRMEQGQEQGLSEEFVKGIFERIHAESVRVQEKTIGQHDVKEEQKK